MTSFPSGKSIFCLFSRFQLICVCVRHHVFVKTGRDVQLAEVGPRLEMKRLFILVSFQCKGLLFSFCDIAYEIRQGTIEQTEAEREWVLTHYTRTAKKRSVLSGSRFSDPQAKPAKR
jgi:U3 small nucleolar ribonucleoprotein protein IMP4